MNHLIGTEENPTGSGLGYVVIPSNVERKLYIKSVYKNKALMIRSEDGNTFRNVAVTNDTIQRLTFPKTDKGVGSTVVWVNIPKSNQKVVIGVIDVMSAANKLVNEFQTKIEEITENGSTSTSWDAENVEISMSVTGVSGKGKMNVSVSNPDSTAELNVFVDGIANIKASKQLNLVSNELIQFTVSDAKLKQLFIFRYKNSEGLTIQDEFGNVIKTNEDVIKIFGKNGEKSVDWNEDFLVLGTDGKDKELAVLGETLKKLIEDLISVLKGAKTMTNLGPQPFMPTTQKKLTNLNNRVKDILSKSVKLD